MKPPSDVNVVGPIIELDTKDSEECNTLIIRSNNEGDVVMYLAQDDVQPIVVDRIFRLEPKAAIQIAQHLERLALQLLGGIN